MAKQHVARTYRDGPDGNTAIVAAGLNDDQDSLFKYGVAIGDLEDAIGNVGGGTTLLRIGGVGTTAQRASVPPTLGTIYVNTERKVNEVGWDTEWRNPDGTTIAGGTGTGTSNAPQNTLAVTNSNNSIDITASPVTSATLYTLYELRQTTPLATSSTPSFHRTPGGTGTYGWSITSTVGGVESAPSSIAYCALPFGSTVTPGGGSTGGGAIDTPSEILRLGQEGGHWSLDVARPSGNTSISMDTIEAGYSETPYYLPTSDNTGVIFRVPVNGGTTPNSTYPRVELRERNADGSNASWSGKSGTHALSGTSRVLHLPPAKPELVVAQIHDTSGVSSTAIGDRLQVRVEDDQWMLSINGSTLSTPILTGYTLNTNVAWSVKVTSGVVVVRINGTIKYNATPSGWPTSGLYYKVGDYLQSNTSKEGTTSEYGSLVIVQNSLLLSHS